MSCARPIFWRFQLIAARDDWLRPWQRYGNEDDDAHQETTNRNRAGREGAGQSADRNER
jgi:hypothetical protein